MRNDMYKVIVERPRRGGHGSACRRVDDPEESPRCEGLRKRHRDRKWLNENLRPLERYLGAQVGRPWDKVYADICAGIDRRSTVQQHIHQHLTEFVAITVVDIGGTLCAPGWSGPEPIGRYWGPAFYVDPRTGLLRRNRLRERARREYAETRGQEMQSQHGHRRIIDAMHQLHRIHDLWFWVELATVADAMRAPDQSIDVLRRLEAGKCPEWKDAKGIRSNYTLFGRTDVYARSKRQLSARELQQYGLSNTSDRQNT